MEWTYKDKGLQIQMCESMIQPSTSLLTSTRDEIYDNAEGVDLPRCQWIFQGNWFWVSCVSSVDDSILELKFINRRMPYVQPPHESCACFQFETDERALDAMECRDAVFSLFHGVANTQLICVLCSHANIPQLETLRTLPPVL